MRIMIEMSGSHWSQQRKMAAGLGLSTAKDVNGKNVHKFAILETDDIEKLIGVMSQIEYPITIVSASGLFSRHNRVDCEVRDKSGDYW